MSQTNSVTDSEIEQAANKRIEHLELFYVKHQVRGYMQCIESGTDDDYGCFDRMDLAWPRQKKEMSKQYERKLKAKVLESLRDPDLPQVKKRISHFTPTQLQREQDKFNACLQANNNQNLCLDSVLQCKPHEKFLANQLDRSVKRHIWATEMGYKPTSTHVFD